MNRGYGCRCAKASALALCIVVICLAVSLVACSSQPDVPRESTSQPEAQSVAAETPDAQTSASETGEEKQMDAQTTQIIVSINGRELFASLADNPSAQALAELLARGPLTISMHDYGSMEKIGSIGQSLPASDTQVTTEPGDIILYQGNQLTIYYDVNTWNFTHLGKIEGVSASELKEVLGSGDVDVTFSLA